METVALHEAFITSLGSSVIEHSDPEEKPLDLQLQHPLPRKIRLYIFNLTNPSGGRASDEYKIQLIVPDQQRGERGSFNSAGVNLVLLAGYEPELAVFVLWDAQSYPDFAYSRNVQVKAMSVFAALAGEIGKQERNIRGQGIETVLTADEDMLYQAILLRVETTLEKLLAD